VVESPSQLPLPLPHAPQYGRDSFLPAPSNAAALHLVDRWPDWPAPVVVLSGPPGSGKTHLAHIWAERSGAAIHASEWLDAANRPPLRLGGGLVVEDLSMADVPQEQLFHLINSAREAGASLLLTSRAPATDWRIALPDLRSRLRMAAPVALAPPDDDLLRKVMVKLFADRQLTIDKPVLDYLLVRMERSLSAAAVLVEALDREALASARRITRPLAARILAGDNAGADEFTETK
jgi:chromosomal replication initiation ATPase DnaA